MTKTAKITRFDPNGPNGLEVWEKMDEADLVAGDPVQRGHLYHEIEAQGYMTGVWDCTAFSTKMMPYPVDEYMYFFSGGLTMALPDGTEIPINAGDAFIIPKGFECQWIQPETVHKVFMILYGPVPEADKASLKRITVPDLSPMGAPEVTASRTDFLNAAGTMQVEVVTCGAVSRPARAISANELITVLDGTLSLNDGETTHEVTAGETVYLHQGGTVGWTTSAGTRMIVASFTQNG